ncbi:MAG: HIRAN domain-containing protein [Atopobiaceae bacterium]|nr:HIRAN domain-containing protein [Atopobiaceae bacterium]
MSTETSVQNVLPSESVGLASVTSSTAGALLVAMHQGSGSVLDVPKPFSQPICLVPDTRIAGTAHVEGIDELVERLTEGTRLELVRDAKNRYDRWAIELRNSEGEHLGFVPADINEIPARLMDGGKRLFAEITDIELRGSWWKIGIGVWLDD